MSELKDLYMSEDFSEIILKHLVRDRSVFDLAKAVGMRSEDLLTSSVAGIRLYKVLGDIIFDIGAAPIDSKILLTYIKLKLDAGELEGFSIDSVLELYNYIYTDTLNVAYVLEHLENFIKVRRAIKLQVEHHDEPLDLMEELGKLAIDIGQSKQASKVTSVKPFETLVYTERIEGIPTGFNKIDNKAGSICKGECGLLLGHSGSGKTATASQIALRAASEGYKVLYICLEEPLKNVVHRWYANKFEINYTRLHLGQAEIEKEEAFKTLTPEDKEKLGRLDIVDARDLTPATTEDIKQILEDKAAEGFIPDMVILDQLDYMRPMKALPKGSQRWQEYEVCAFECDLLSQYKIAGEYEFALWVVHQATGDMKWTFDYTSIAGCKGIVKPFDVAIGVGRESRDSPMVNLFSLKVRHASHYSFPYRAEFEYMKFYDSGPYTPTEKKKKSGQRINSNPIPG